MGIVSRVIKRGRKDARDKLGRFVRQSIKRDIAGVKAIGRWAGAQLIGPLPRAVAPARPKRRTTRKRTTTRKAVRR
jgi:hypothetical protein